MTRLLCISAAAWLYVCTLVALHMPLFCRQSHPPFAHIWFPPSSRLTFSHVLFLLYPVLCPLCFIDALLYFIYSSLQWFYTLFCFSFLNIWVLCDCRDLHWLVHSSQNMMDMHKWMSEWMKEWIYFLTYNMGYSTKVLRKYLLKDELMDEQMNTLLLCVLYDHLNPPKILNLEKNIKLQMWYNQCRVRGLIIL